MLHKFIGHSVLITSGVEILRSERISGAQRVESGWGGVAVGADILAKADCAVLRVLWLAYTAPRRHMKRAPCLMCLGSGPGCRWADCHRESSSSLAT